MNEGRLRLRAAMLREFATDSYNFAAETVRKTA